jgi:hypothetical protein
MEKTIIVLRSSLALILPKQICEVLSIQGGSVVDISVDEEGLHVRPLGVTRLPTRRETRKVQSAKLPAKRPHTELLGALDAWGMTKQHFQRMSHDGMGLGEFAGTVSIGEPVDPITIERLKMC